MNPYSVPTMCVQELITKNIGTIPLNQRMNYQSITK